MTNLSDEHRVERRSLSAGRFLLLLLVVVAGLVAVLHWLEGLSDTWALVVILATAVVLAAVAWFKRD